MVIARPGGPPPNWFPLFGARRGSFPEDPLAGLTRGSSALYDQGLGIRIQQLSEIS